MERVGWFSGMLCCFWPGEDGDKGHPFLCLRISHPCGIKTNVFSDFGQNREEYFFIVDLCVSGVQRSDSLVHIFIVLMFFSHLGYYRVLRRVPCELQQVLVIYFIYGAC